MKRTHGASDLKSVYKVTNPIYPVQKLLLIIELSKIILLLKQEHEISKIINVLIPFVVSMTQMAMTILRPTVVSQLDYSAVSIR